MTDVEEPATEPSGERTRLAMFNPPTRERRWALIAGLLRALAITCLLVVAYYFLPFDHSFGPGTLATLCAALLGVALMITWETRKILDSSYPAIKGIEALAMIVPLFLLIFASAYYLMDRSLPQSFGQHLSRTDSLYFTITTFSTVGYGDITAKTDGARVAVIFQMLGDLLVLGFGVRIIIGAVQLRLRPQASPTPPVASEADSPRATPGAEDGDQPPTKVHRPMPE
jgi:Ion channel